MTMGLERYLITLYDLRSRRQVELEKALGGNICQMQY